MVDAARLLDVGVVPPQHGLLQGYFETSTFNRHLIDDSLQQQLTTEEILSMMPEIELKRVDLDTHSPYTDAVNCHKKISSANPYYIKRPMNAFMVWSQKLREIMQRRGRDLHNADISKKLGEAWRTLSEAQKQPFVIYADQLRLAHVKQFPTYKYKPKKKLAAKKEIGAETLQQTTDLKGNFGEARVTTKQQQSRARRNSKTTTNTTRQKTVAVKLEPLEQSFGGRSHVQLSVQRSSYLASPLSQEQYEPQYISGGTVDSCGRRGGNFGANSNPLKTEYDYVSRATNFSVVNRRNNSGGSSHCTAVLSPSQMIHSPPQSPEDEGYASEHSSFTTSTSAAAYKQPVAISTAAIYQNPTSVSSNYSASASPNSLYSSEPSMASPSSCCSVGQFAGSSLTNLDTIRPPSFGTMGVVPNDRADNILPSGFYNIADDHAAAFAMTTFSDDLADIKNLFVPQENLSTYQLMRQYSYDLYGNMTNTTATAEQFVPVKQEVPDEMYDTFTLLA